MENNEKIGWRNIKNRAEKRLIHLLLQNLKFVLQMTPPLGKQRGGTLFFQE